MKIEIRIHFDEELRPINCLNYNNTDKELYIGYEYNTEINNFEKELRSVKYVIEDISLPYPDRPYPYLIDTTLLLPKNIYPESCIACNKKLEKTNMIWSNNILE
jgi:hypothetical protein